MKEIRMVDLKTQYHRIKPEVDGAIMDVIESTQFIKGPAVKKFEDDFARYMGVKDIVSCANGTDALQIAMMALGYQPGDEVITASFTYVATAEVIALLKLTPVLVEVNPDTFTIDPAAIEAAITSRTKAIVPVHLFGQAADMEAILQIAAKHGLHVIEDNAQATGADITFSDGRKVKAGTVGTVGTTSFFPSKNLGCYGDGGALFVNNDELARKIRVVSNHGQTQQYVHDEIGVNSRLDTIQAAILNVKLKYLDEYAAKRLAVADFYDQAFKGLSNVQTPVRASYSSHVFHQYTLKINGTNRDELRNKLSEKGIPSMIYYPIALHLQKAYKDSRYKEGAFPVTEQLCKSVLSLPIHTEFEPEQLDYIVSNFRQLVQS